MAAPRLPDLVGRRFGRLVVLSEKRERGCRRAQTVCDCGAIKSIRIYALISGNTASCGCLMREASVRNGHCNKKHGHAGKWIIVGEKRVWTVPRSATYQSWTAMRARCTNPKARNYPLYGGRSITICQRWLDSFETFLADMGERPSGTSIDRIDGQGNYEPGNCKWSTPKEQSNNRRKRRSGLRRRQPHVDQVDKNPEFTD